jgi:serine/threonine protein kinase
MLTASGAKLMDFGLAKAMTVSSKATVGSSAAPSFTAAATAVSSSPLTTAGTVIGTVQYMSPEQIEGKEIDSRSDIFSLGSVLYEMASGKQAFEGKSQISLASAILEKDPEPISTIKPMIPAAFEHALATCLQKEADQRYQTAHDLKLHLQWITTSSSSMAMSAMPRRARKHEPRRSHEIHIQGRIAVGRGQGDGYFALSSNTLLIVGRQIAAGRPVRLCSSRVNDFKRGLNWGKRSRLGQIPCSENQRIGIETV